MNYKEDLNNRFTVACNRIIEAGLVENKSRLAESIGIANNKLSEILSNRMKAGVIEIQKLCNTYCVSFDYLFNDEGDVFLQKKETPITLELEKPQNRDKKPQRVTPITRNETLIVPIPSKAFDKRLERQDVPLYDFDAVAGLTPVFNGQSTPVDYISIPNMPKVDGAVPICGDSMYPLLKSGDIVMYKIVSDLTNIIWGEMYLISMYYGEDDYISVKYIKRVDDDPSKVLLVSYNTHHSPKEVPIESIRALGLIKATVRFNTMG